MNRGVEVDVGYKVNIVMTIKVIFCLSRNFLKFIAHTK